MLSLVIATLFITTSAAQLFSAEGQKLDRVRIGYSSISSSRIALWAANEAGFFKNRVSPPK
jgi:hypothetical protein